MEAAFGDGDDDLAAHDRALQMGVRVVLAAVVRVLRMRLLRGKFFEPFFKIPVQAGLVVVNEDACGAMRCLFAICP